MVSRSLRASALLALLAVACSTSDGSNPEPAPRGAGRVDVGGSIAHRDPRLGGAPTFVWLNRAGAPAFANASEAAVAILPSIARSFGAAADAPASLAHVDDLGKGPIVARYEQRFGGLEVFRGGVNVVMTRALEPVAASGFLAPTARGSERPFAIGSSEALAIGARLVGRAGAFSPVAARDGYERFSGAGLLAPARVKKVLYPLSGGEGVELEPAWYVELLVAEGPARAWVVSATDGRVLFENDLVRYDAFTYRVYADAESMRPMDGPQGNLLAPHPTGKPDKQKLEWQPSQLVTLQNYPFSRNDPWLAPNATTTSGNNVVAYADRVAPDGFDPGADTAPALTADKTFDHLYDTAASPDATPASIQASATQLFYVTNFLHDWFYDAGFDEKSYNHQLDNFGRGGLGGDPLYAEAQDNSGRNNANAMVPPDGQAPRIQMFVFGGASDASLVVSAPASIAGTKSVGIASGFGQDAFDVSGSVVLAVDGGGADPADACEPLEMDAAGKIVLVHRGTCSFAQKAEAAQAAGAAGVIIANVASSTNPTVAPFMGGQQAGITIPVLSLSLADGQALEGALAAGATVTMKRSAGGDLDGALDTTIVAHEWGHVLSSRLVGNGMGLRTNQAGGLGEGWGDFTALLLMARADDPGNFGGTYANGSYATSGSGDDIYFGTRRLPYSIDFTKNALTLKHIANGNALPANVTTSFGEDGSFNAEVHNTGEVWATMLWECYASLLREGRLSFDEAEDRMRRYLVASLKLTPSDPTIIEARDAVLAAALAVDAKDFELFWKAFARRGAGAGALAPPKDSTTNQGVKESFESGNDLQIVEATLTDDVISCDHDGILDEAEVGTIELTVRNSGSGPLTQPKAELLAKSEGVTVVDPVPSTLPALAPFESAKVKLRASVKGPTSGAPIELDVAVSDPALPDGRVVHVVVPTRYDADQAPASSAVDHVDTTKTVWRVAGEGAGEKWARSTTTGDGHWEIGDPPQRADHKLTSPSFTVSETTFSLTFKHRWSFKRSVRRNVDIDGGVVEISVDGGKTWEDVSTYGKIDYNTTLDASDRTDNPLKGREAYGAESPGYPDEWVTSRVDVTLPEVPEDVRIRFRVGASFGRAAEGWAIDDIELGGVSSTPFWSFVPHADECDPNGPTTNAGPPQVVASGASVKLAGAATHPADLPLTYLWSQVSGPEVTLAEGETLTPSFTAPSTSEPVTVTFALRAHERAPQRGLARRRRRRAGEGRRRRQIARDRTTPASRPTAGALALSSASRRVRAPLAALAAPVARSARQRRRARPRAPALRWRAAGGGRARAYAVARCRNGSSRAWDRAAGCRSASAARARPRGAAPGPMTRRGR
ncbi:MAG: M36 family metallopeptidase [Labilithrix sp.]|nr:M36 family metallopeptidase [Labilithrix sp.]